MIPEPYIQELYARIKAEKLDKRAIMAFKLKLSKKYGLKKIPTDIEIFLTNPDPEVKKALQTKPVRTISGVVPIAVMTKPDHCPHGQCTFCPGGPKSVFGDVPQSYTGKEPASMRGMRAGWDPYLQVFNRLEQYVVLGHSPEKCDVIVMGGTVLAVKDNYVETFVKFVYKAMNDFSELFYVEGEFDMFTFKKFFELPGDVNSSERRERIQKKLLSMKGDCDLEEVQVKNEESHIKCIGLTIETKPDWGFKEHGDRMLDLGCTRVELGVQSTLNKPLLKSGRGHTVKDNIKSIKELKDLGFKLNFHYMPGLPSVKREEEVDAFRTVFEDSDWRPDMLKIYPCMVMPGTMLYDQWKLGKFVPLTTAEAAELIVEFKRFVPKYCRIMRVQRDIPTYRTTAGVDKTNLRQYVEKLKKEKGVTCHCIRCREIKGAVPEDEEIVYDTMEYDASGGKEFFIEARTTGDKLLGFCRMRYPSESLRSEITMSSALIRELHVYGPALNVSGEGGEKKTQHRGVGRKLLLLAEEIAKNNGRDKMVVISGVGVRGYYRKRGYTREGRYMVKKI